MKKKLPVDKFLNLPTPFFYYDMGVLNKTISRVKEIVDQRAYHMH